MKQVTSTVKLVRAQNAEPLLRSVRQLKSVLLPLSDELEREKTEKTDVMKRLERLQKDLSEDIHVLQGKLEDMQNTLDGAITSKKRAKDQLQSALKENERLIGLNEKVQNSLRKKTTDVAQLETALEESKNEKRALKKKLRILTKSSAMSPRQEANPDDSLLILSEPEVWKSLLPALVVYDRAEPMFSRMMLRQKEKPSKENVSGELSSEARSIYHLQ
ncbi:hypothetical protein H0H92_010338 [Tricholoma furcatifolium]|nr:hypothetical protein H0H92_010338 [Tricholoma furcatifolium]